MRKIILLSLSLLSTAGATTSPGWRFEELRRIPAAEARQGVAADGGHLYAINNHAIGKYRKDTGERVGGWACAEGDPLIHLNAGLVHAGRLHAAHSNYPGVPMHSSVETWDPVTLSPAGSHSFGRTDGSLTWLDRRNDGWIACFVHYAKKGGEPGRGPEWTRLVEFDDEWRVTGGWVLPPALVAKLAVRGYSCSGGAMGPGGYLYVTGHDDPELYVLEFPGQGAELRWIATVAVPAEGQGFCWDPAEPGVIYLLSRRTREIIAGRVHLPGV
jgi:hypothetical protein